MAKYWMVALLFLSGCSNFSINAKMCDQIARDPHATMPQECRNYVESEAEKAFKNEQKVLSPAEVIEYAPE